MDRIAERHQGYRRIVAVITLLLFIDGFDLFLLGKIAPAIAAGYGHEPAALSGVFTWHQAGLAIGAFLMPMLADRYGAKRLLVVMCFFIGVGSLASSFAPNITSFAWLRGFTGIFIAGVLPVGLSLLSEKVPAARFGTLMSIALTGMSAGAAANGVSAAWLLDLYGWQSGIWLGAALPIAAIPLVIAWVPESTRFTEAPSPRRRSVSPADQLAGVFGERRAVVTLLLWSICFLTMGQTALVAVWMPTYFQELGGISIQRFALIAMLSLVGGALGTLAIGWVQDRANALTILILAYLGNGLGMAVLGLITFGTAGFALAFTVWTFVQSASIAGLSLIMTRAYPVSIRATGVGWAACAGRIGGMIAPSVGALILIARPSLLVALCWAALPMLLLGLFLLPLLGIAQRRTVSAPATETVATHA